jgi:hypothetical protein
VSMDGLMVERIGQGHPIPASGLAQEGKLLLVRKRSTFVSCRITLRSLWLVIGHQNKLRSSLLGRGVN